MPVAGFGLDAWLADDLGRCRGARIGVVCNQASIASDCRHILDHLLPRHREGRVTIAVVFGPQHGVWGHTQDNMVEWSGYEDPRTGLRFVSLYGERREPASDILRDLDYLVFDLPDVGARYYTFIWTLALCLRACSQVGLPLVLLDRPNPLGGMAADGPVLDPAYASFVGLHSMPARHGLTIGEIAGYLQSTYYPSANLEIVKMPAWRREWFYEATRLPWAMPSPNMPTVDTAFVYPGMCLLEGTTLSEGRGTTRPFECFGGPDVDGWRLCEDLNRLDLDGVCFRPVQFEPTFQKHALRVCQGAFIHVLDRIAYRPVLTAVAALSALRRTQPEAFQWTDPPYEYEDVLLPFDILAGNGWLRPAIDEGSSLAEITQRMDREASAFAPAREAAMLY